ncbi:MAG: MarR family winged helix-turn-helix transcriptional regulator [Pseudobdellovibrionaceae bacterium]
MRIKKFIHVSPIPAIISTQMELMRSLNYDLEKVDLSYIEALVLTTLFFEGDKKSNTPSAISRNLLLPLPRISSAITQLGLRGFIERELISEDSRMLKINLSNKGHRKAMEAVELFHKKQLWIENELGEKPARDLNAMLLKLRSSLKNSRPLSQS